MRSARSGITLVEVLLAAVVCGAGLAVVLSAMSTSIRAEMNADMKVKAVRLLDVQIGRLEAGVLSVTAASGDFTDDGMPDFQWNMDVIADPTVANLQQVTVTVSWIEHGETRSLDAVRLIYTDPDAGSQLGGTSTSQTPTTSVGTGSIQGQGSLSGTGSSSGSASGSAAKTTGSTAASGSLLGSGSGSSGSLLGSGSSSSGGSGSSGSLLGSGSSSSSGSGSSGSLLGSGSSSSGGSTAGSSGSAGSGSQLGSGSLGTGSGSSSGSAGGP